MKKVYFLLICLLMNTRGAAQHSFSIDTVQLTYTIKDVIDLHSTVPQLNGLADIKVQEAINKNIRSYFKADIRKDSVAFINALFEENNISTIAELIERKKEEELISEEMVSESFAIPYVSEDFLSFTYESYIHPRGGQAMFNCESVVYDLKTGEPVVFTELFSIQPEQFRFRFLRNGYWKEELSTADTAFTLVPASKALGDAESFTEQLYGIKNGDCVSFYLETEEEELHVSFKSMCEGPMPMELGIKMQELAEWIKHPALHKLYKR